MAQASEAKNKPTSLFLEQSRKAWTMKKGGEVSTFDVSEPLVPLSKYEGRDSKLIRGAMRQGGVDRTTHAFGWFLGGFGRDDGSTNEDLSAPLSKRAKSAWGVAGYGLVGVTVAFGTLIYYGAEIATVGVGWAALPTFSALATAAGWTALGTGLATIATGLLGLAEPLTR